MQSNQITEVPVGFGRTWTVLNNFYLTNNKITKAGNDDSDDVVDEVNVVDSDVVVVTDND